MDYIITFLEGILTFISPCLLPMLPIYLSYLAGTNNEEKNQKNKMIYNAIGFIAGFTIIFILLGAAAGSIGIFIKGNKRIFDIISGIIIIIFGLNFAGIINIKLLNKTAKLNVNVKPVSFLSAMIFGAIFAIGWSPCVGAFLGSALMLAANSQTTLKGVALLLSYSIGLGIPFLLSAILMKQLSETFSFIKKHYKIINLVSGIILIIIGVLMISGYFNMLLSFLTPTV